MSYMVAELIIVDRWFPSSKTCSNCLAYAFFPDHTFTYQSPILIINGAGRVGSIAIQIAKKLAKLNVIATASRPETIAWCQKMGTDEVVNHRNNLAEEIDKFGYQNVDYILCLNDTDGHWQAMTKAIKPQGTIFSIRHLQKRGRGQKAEGRRGKN